MKTNVDFINSQEEAIYKDKITKSKEKDKQNTVSMKVVKENIEEENKDENKLKEGNNNEKKLEEDPVFSHINSHGKILDEEIDNANKLILNEIEGNLFEGKTIEINAGGMVGGRGVKDGFTIFGQIKLNDKENKEENKFSPDYELNYTEKYLLYPYIFAIYYKKEEKAYYIRAFSGKGSGNKILFIKLKSDDKFILKKRELISAGDTIFQINQLEDNSLEIIKLERKKNHNFSSMNSSIFNGEKKKIITLGRSRECDYSFPKDKSFSRFQTTFEYDENKKQWSITDGKDKKSSTNGTWIFGSHSFLIKNEMFVEILNSKILIKEVINADNKENVVIK